MKEKNFSSSSQATRDRALDIIKILRKATTSMVEPAGATIVKQYGRDPYLVLIACILSLRTRDTVSLPASQRLFEHAKTPQEMIRLPLPTLEKAIYPSGFYHTKAKTIKKISHELITKFNGKVPNNRDDLLTLPGVGPKTTALVLADGFDIPAICVDTHVHRISNRLGIVRTKTVEETEQELMKVLPQEFWAEWNKLMVMHGQNICVPISPFCSKCPVFDLCERNGVKRSR